MPYIEQGERDFAFWFEMGEQKAILDRASRIAQHFNRAPMVLSFYPTGAGEIPSVPLGLEENELVNLEAFKQAENGNGYIVRLFNPTGEEQRAVLRFGDVKKEVVFGKYEIKTLRCTENSVEEDKLMEHILD